MSGGFDSGFDSGFGLVATGAPAPLRPGVVGLGLGLGLWGLRRPPVATSSAPVFPEVPAFTGRVAFGSFVQSYPTQTRCCRVRRDLDDAEMDIGFVGGWRDDVALQAFAQGTQCYLVRWYGQEPDGNPTATTDWVQANASIQPRITDAIGVPILDPDTGNPAVWFSASNQVIPSLGWAKSENQRVVHVVINRQGSGQFLGATGNAWYQLIDLDNGVRLIINGTNGYLGPVNGWPVGDTTTLTFQTRNSAAGDAFQDGTVPTPRTPLFNANWNSEFMRLGTGTGSNSGGTGYVSEMLFHEGVWLSTAEMQQFHADRTAIWGTA